jgi:ribonuclease BN (tRNA processing enzyme)
MGPGTLRQVARAGANYETIGRIFLSHFHPDHTADLVHLLFATRNPEVLRRRRPFVLTGPRGLRDFIARLQGAYRNWLQLPPKIMKLDELDHRPKGMRDYENIRVRYCTTTHTPESIAYRMEDRKGRSLVYSGDTGYCDAIVDLAKGARLLILEASFPDDCEVEGHLTPSQAGRIASLAGVDRLLLIHFYPECLATEIAAQCRRSYGGELILGSDLLHLRL